MNLPESETYGVDCVRGHTVLVMPDTVETHGSAVFVTCPVCDDEVLVSGTTSMLDYDNWEAAHGR